METYAGTHHTGRLQWIERLTRRPFTERLLDQPAPEWPRWLAQAVAKTKPSDFAIRTGDLDRSLDLIAVARR
jgi:hypothetical protein